MPEWSKFKIGVPGLNRSNQDCLRFDTISHTCHVDSALSILDRGEIRPYLVFDESKLNDQRILVSWLSPNDWGLGFRYGNIRFNFDLKSLITDKRFYWVESIAYKIPACRILVTDKNYDGRLEPYVPSSPNGPWWHDIAKNIHYFNGLHCLEFMFECAISMKNINSIDFVSHHNDYCSIHRANSRRCKELGFSAEKGGAVFIARAVASGFNLKNISPHFIRDNGRPKLFFESAFDELRNRVSQRVSFNGDLYADSKEGSAVAQAICSAYSFHQINSARTLASFYCTEAECDSALAMVVSSIVDLDRWGRLVD